MLLLSHTYQFGLVSKKKNLKAVLRGQTEYIKHACPIGEPPTQHIASWSQEFGNFKESDTLHPPTLGTVRTYLWHVHTLTITGDHIK